MRLRCIPSDLAPLFLLFFSIWPTGTLAYDWPGDPRLDALERFVYEGARPDGADLFVLLGECSLRPRKNVQSTTFAATWLRMAFHDSATFNITDQTGGLDGSIHFELDRAENTGDGLKQTQREYSSHTSKYVSKADVIAIGAAGSLANCGGPLIPVRGGRTDAKEAGRPGTPEPEQDLATHTEQFRLQGFSPTEMIEITACGHTMGGVESKDFPTIVDLRSNNPDFDSVSAPFDDTTAFDTTVVTQYLDGTTKNPLVVGRNVTTRSDLRIFNSDGNVTIRALADPSNFQKRCGILFEKMLNTVPAGVQLTEPIEVIADKPHFNTGLRIGNHDEGLTFLTSLRLARPVKEPYINGSRISLHWCDKYGNDANCQSGFSNKISGSPRAFNRTGSPFLVRSKQEFRIYPFRAPIDPSRSISRFWWEVEQGNGAETLKIDNNGAKYPVLQDQVAYATTLSSSLGSRFTQNGTLGVVETYFAVVGVRADIKPSRVYLDLFDNAYNGRTPGSITSMTVDLALNNSIPSVSGYNFYSALFDAESGGGPTFDFHVDTDGKTSSVNFEPFSFGMLLPEDSFIADLGKVERAVYSGTPVQPPPTPSSAGTPSATPTSSAVVFATPPGMSLLLGLVLATLVISSSAGF